MKIGINGYEAVMSRVGTDKQTGKPIRVGSGEYAFRIISEIYNLFSENEFYIYLPKKDHYDLPEPNSKWHYIYLPNSRFWTLTVLPKYLRTKKEKIDLFFSPTHYSPIWHRIPTVISLMDLSYLFYPRSFRVIDLWQLKVWTRLSVVFSQAVITISEASKDDILKKYRINKKKIFVTYPGIKNKFLKKDESMDLKKFNIDFPYILFVGTLQPRKNIVKLMEAFGLVISDKKNNLSFKNLKLVIVGKPGWMYKEILQAPKKLSLEKDIVFLDSVNDEDLAVLYQNAECFVLPSLYEGFGLPILEAMKNNCPVLTSNVSSMPEAGGDAAIYFNPHSVIDIADKLIKVLTNDKLRKEMVKKGQKQVEKFSWEKTARETLRVLEEVAGKKL